MKYILIAFILMAPEEYDALILDEGLTGADCIQQLEAVEQYYDILTCELTR